MPTIGQIKLASILPQDMKEYAFMPLDKKNSRKMFTDLARNHPEEYTDVLAKLQDFTKEVSTTHGQNLSVSLKDLVPPEEIKTLRKEMDFKIDSIAQSSKFDRNEKRNRIDQVFRDYQKDLEEVVTEAAVKDGNVFGDAVRHGFRGSPGQLVQLMLGDIGVRNHEGQTIPIAGLKGYGEGVSPEDFWVGSANSRKGVMNVQFATADTGYLGKQLSLLANRARITGKDCGVKDVGMFKETDSPDLIGRILAKDTAGIPEGTVLNQKHIKHLANKGRDRVVARSPMTCQFENGICQKCMGKDSEGHFPEIGEFVGIDAARLLSEPLVQSGLESKHTGSSDIKNAGGFEIIEQFLNVPQNFHNRAVLSQEDGKVTAVKKADQGGYDVFINSKKHYIPSDREPQIQKGDRVEKGDVVSTGLPSPREVVELKGIGPARDYFIRQFRTVLNNSGVDIYERHLDAVMKDYFNNVEITDPEGFGGFSVGQTAPYTYIRKHYKPPENTSELALNKAKGLYLQQPKLHYPIGTRVTPSVIKDLRSEQITKIPVAKQEPPFKPYVSRLIDRPAKDPDWKVRMGGWNIKRSLMDAVTHGSESPKEEYPSAIGELFSIME